MEIETGKVRLEIDELAMSENKEEKFSPKWMEKLEFAQYVWENWPEDDEGT